MGFRFRRSVKLLPGIRLNFGLRSASLSIGAPGAMLNFSSRGARTTFGIPGTGFSWSPSSRSGQLPQRYRQPAQPGHPSAINTVADLEAAVRNPNATVVYRGSGRRLSPQQIEAAHKKLLSQERRQEAQAEIEQVEVELKERLACWREMPSLPTSHDYHAALVPQSFVYQSAPPRSPDLARERDQLEEQLRRRVDASSPRVQIAAPAALAVGGLLVAAAVATGTSLLIQPLALDSALSWLRPITIGIAVLGLVMGAILFSRRTTRRARAIDAETAQQRDQAWPSVEQHVLQRHATAVAGYERGRAEAETSWRNADDLRIAWATRLMRGDTEAVHEAVSESLGDLDFPFETEALFAVEDAQVGYLHVDLPEIEDVMPETRLRVLTDGRTKEIKRVESERNAEYGELACGIGLMMASAAFTAAPTMAMLHVAAYTQREQKGKDKGQVADDYVYVASIPRSAFVGLNASGVVALPFVASMAKLEQQANLRLKKLAPKELPQWVGELRGEQPRSLSTASEPLRISTL